MKRILTLTALLLTAVILTASCGTTEESDPTTATIPKQMQANSIDYVGDSTGVGRLLALLPGFDDNFIQNMFSLQTQDMPYGITIFYEPSGTWSGDSMAISDEMTVYAGHLFQSIGNLGYVEFAYRLSNASGHLDISQYYTLLRVYRD